MQMNLLNFDQISDPEYLWGQIEGHLRKQSERPERRRKRRGMMRLSEEQIWEMVKHRIGRGVQQLQAFEDVQEQIQSEAENEINESGEESMGIEEEGEEEGESEGQAEDMEDDEALEEDTKVKPDEEFYDEYNDFMKKVDKEETDMMNEGQLGDLEGPGEDKDQFQAMYDGAGLEEEESSSDEEEEAPQEESGTEPKDDTEEIKNECTLIQIICL